MKRFIVKNLWVVVLILTMKAAGIGSYTAIWWLSLFAMAVAISILEKE